LSLILLYSLSIINEMNTKIVAIFIVTLAVVSCFATTRRAVIRGPKPAKGLPVKPLLPFPCQPYEYFEDDVPTNVNKLRAHDIKAVMTIGDSITAAFGATSGEILSLPFVPREYRFLSYAGGGGSMRYTLPNFINVYNRKSLGGAVGYTLPTDDLSYGPNGTHIEPVLKDIYNLNAALSGAVVQTLPQEIDMLVHQLTHLYNQTIDFNNDWKLATILIGANNMCGACHNNSANSADTYEQQLDSSLQYLYEKIPRVRVNLLPMFNISQVWYWHNTDEYCRIMWDTISSSECSCITPKSNTQQDRELVDIAAEQYRQRLVKVAQKWAAKNLTTFAVTVQPFTYNFKIVNSELTSSFDCFHPSNASHAYLAAGLWNSLFLPENQKPTNATKLMLEGFDWICPTKDMYLM